jgi:prephenate dehydrogenase
LIRRLAILGVGLLGGSVAKAARSLGLAQEIVGIGRDLTRLQPALRDGTLDGATTDIADAVRQANFIVLAAPVLVNERLLAEVWAGAAADAVVTDVGSTKSGIVAAAERLAGSRSLAFVGSHPMAGSEQAGYGVARADLFQGASVIVTPTDATDGRALKRVTELWEALGAHVSALDPSTHDRVVAAVSHLPHLVAFALVDAVRAFEPGAMAFAARGFKDTTRIAASEPAVWREIFLSNREALRRSTEAFRAALDRIETLVADGDGDRLETVIASIKAEREAIR